MKNQKIGNIIGKMVLTGIFLAMAYFVGIIGLLYLCQYVRAAQALQTLGCAYVIFVLYICFKIWSVKRHLKVKKLFIGLECTAAVAFILFSSVHSYEQSLPTVSDKFRLYDFMAYHGSRVAALDEPSALRLTEDLPIIDCATALYPVASAFVQAVYPENEYSLHGFSDDGSVPVYCSGTASAYNNLIKGDVDVIFAAGPSDKQLEAARQAGVELIMTPIGREAFVFFVNNKNPVTDLTVDELRQIYSGQITDWSTVGGKDGTIKAFQRNENSGSQTALEQFMQGEKLMTAPKEDIVTVMDGIIEVVSDYRNYENAIGFSFRFYSTEMVTNEEIHLLSLDGIAPDKDSIRDGTYPISSEFYAITTASSNANTELLIQWILSDQGQFLIEETGYVGINESL